MLLLHHALHGVYFCLLRHLAAFCLCRHSSMFTAALQQCGVCLLSPGCGGHQHHTMARHASCTCANASLHASCTCANASLHAAWFCFQPSYCLPLHGHSTVTANSAGRADIHSWLCSWQACLHLGVKLHL
jgi:hypothetical protein